MPKLGYLKFLFPSFFFFFLSPTDKYILNGCAVSGRVLCAGEIAQLLCFKLVSDLWQTPHQRLSASSLSKSLGLPLHLPPAQYSLDSY